MMEEVTAVFSLSLSLQTEDTDHDISRGQSSSGSMTETQEQHTRYIRGLKNHIAIIVTDIATWLVILVRIFEFHFHWKKYKDDDDVIFAGICTKQACSLTSGEYDL